MYSVSSLRHPTSDGPPVQGFGEWLRTLQWKKKISMLQNVVTKGFGLGQSLWKDLSSGKFENKGAKKIFGPSLRGKT